MNRAVGELTFGMNQIKIEESISLASLKLEKTKIKLNTAQNEITYLEGEREALSALIDYCDLDEERKKVFCKLFVHDDDYEHMGVFDVSELSLAQKRLEDVLQRIERFEEKRVDYQRVVEFIEKDIASLKKVLKACFRSKISDQMLLDC